MDPRACFFLGEFNDFRYLPPNKVVTFAAERRKNAPRANEKRTAPQRSGGRKTVTCGLGLTPTWKARAYVLTDTASAETQVGVSGHQIDDRPGAPHRRDLVPQGTKSTRFGVPGHQIDAPYLFFQLKKQIVRSPWGHQGQIAVFSANKDFPLEYIQGGNLD